MGTDANYDLVTVVAVHEQRLDGHDDLIERAIAKMDELKTGLLQFAGAVFVALIGAGAAVALH